MNVRAFVCTLLALSAWAAPGRAQEQAVKPYVMLLFDTSGSMRFDVCHNTNAFDHIGGDNSNECPGSSMSCNHCNTFGCGNGQRDDARLFKVKAGAYSVISAFGEVVFGLARFHQVPHGFQCGTSSRDHGGWRGAPDSCSNAAMGTSYNQADVISGFADGNQASLLNWINNCDDYPTLGACPFDVNPGSNTPSSGCSLCPECGGGCDHELRAAGYTPIAGSLYDLRVNYLPGVIASDPKSDCRPYKIILLTDGQDNCPGNPGSCNNQGVCTGEAHELFTLAGKSVPVHVIGFASSSLQDELNDIAQAGGTGQAIMVDNEVSLALAMANIVSETLLVETCNDLDDDCDTLVDEDFPLKGQPCNNGLLGACFATGQYVCKADGSGVVCNAPIVTGIPEICNGIDDNCNGAVDEGIAQGCIPCVPQPEICNGKDDNCNQQTDEGIPPGPCGLAVGECLPGMTKCEGGKLICDGGNAPAAEACDGLDNDCNGVRDGFTEVCYPFAEGCDVAAATCKGQCKLGTRLCTAEQQGASWVGTWGQCTGAVGPGTEVCDGFDNDCDGDIDEQAECPGDSQCIAGQCTRNCTSGEFVCPVGQICKNGWCIRDTCDAAACAAKNWVCKAGACIDPCEGVTCNKLEVCERGACVDQSCYSKGCPSGEVCVQGACKSDACAAVSCAPDQFCQGGQCYGLCDRLSCAEGQTCKIVDNTTRCVDDPCASKQCPAGRACIAGNCEVDPCSTTTCAKGELCVAGECIADTCEVTTCPAGYRCASGICTATERPTTAVLATGTGGCACSIDGTSAAPMWLIWALALLALRRRRG